MLLHSLFMHIFQVFKFAPERTVFVSGLFEIMNFPDSIWRRFACDWRIRIGKIISKSVVMFIVTQSGIDLLIGGLEHCLFFYILRRIFFPIDFHIFQRGRVETNNQVRFLASFWVRGTSTITEYPGLHGPRWLGPVARQVRSGSAHRRQRGGTLLQEESGDLADRGRTGVKKNGGFCSLRFWMYRYCIHRYTIMSIH